MMDAKESKRESLSQFSVVSEERDTSVITAKENSVNDSSRQKFKPKEHNLSEISDHDRKVVENIITKDTSREVDQGHSRNDDAGNDKHGGSEDGSESNKYDNEDDSNDVQGEDDNDDENDVLKEIHTVTAKLDDAEKEVLEISTSMSTRYYVLKNMNKNHNDSRVYI